MVIGIIGLLSAFERELTGERVKASAIARVRQGKWVGGSVPFGYKLVNNGEVLPNGKQPHSMEIDQQTAPYIKMIFEMAAANKSLGEMIHMLDKDRIQTTTKKPYWSRQSLSRIIKNPFYKGMIAYAGEVHKGLHTEIVNDVLWEKANYFLTAKLPGHKFVKTQKEYSNRLKGIIRCGKCGSALISGLAHSHGKTFYYYDCSRAKQKLGCDTKSISATEFDTAILEFFKRAAKDQKIINNALGNAIIESKSKLEIYNREIETLEKELSSVKAAADKLLNLAIENVVSKGTTYKEKMSAYEKKILELETKLTKANAARRAVKLSANSNKYLHSHLCHTMENIDQATPENQTNLLKTLIKSIDVYDDHIVLNMFINDCITPGEQGSPGCTPWLPEYTHKRTSPGSLFRYQYVFERPLYIEKCSISNCNGKHHAKGFCKKHYKAFMRELVKSKSIYEANPTAN